jgi:hypothetical protein
MKTFQGFVNKHADSGMKYVKKEETIITAEYRRLSRTGKAVSQKRTIGAAKFAKILAMGK